jgi:trimethylamine corrinoid protein
VIEQQVLEAAKQAVIDREKETALSLVEQVLAAGDSPMELLEQGFVVGITEVGEQFGRAEIFLPELILSAEVMKVVMDRIGEAMPDEARQKKGAIVIATVKGDVHDIGKSIVVSLLKAHGYEVHDLGRDVDVDTIIQAAIDNNVDLIGTSSLLTTTMGEQRKLEEALRERGLRDRFKTIVGGAPVTAGWAERIRADAYAESAQDGIEKIAQLLGK